MMDGLSLSTLLHREIRTFINILDFFLTLKRLDPITRQLLKIKTSNILECPSWSKNMN